MKIYDAKQKHLKDKISINADDFFAMIEQLYRQPVGSIGRNLAESLIAEIGYKSIDKFFVTHEP